MHKADDPRREKKERAPQVINILEYYSSEWVSTQLFKLIFLLLKKSFKTNIFEWQSTKPLSSSQRTRNFQHSWGDIFANSNVSEYGPSYDEN